MPEGGKGNSRLNFSTTGKMRNVFVQLWAGLSCRSYIKKQIHLYFPTDRKHKTFQSLCFIGFYCRIPLLECIMWTSTAKDYHLCFCQAPSSPTVDQTWRQLDNWVNELKTQNQVNSHRMELFLITLFLAGSYVDTEKETLISYTHAGDEEQK